jgi:hypothetical protein
MELVTDQTKEAPKVLTLEEMLTAIWAQKQLDDMFLMLKGLLDQLKKEPFNTAFIKRRDQLKHDIATLQPIVWETGIAMARHVELKYNCKFILMDGENIPKPGAPVNTEKS